MRTRDSLLGKQNVTGSPPARYKSPLQVFLTLTIMFLAPLT